MLVGSRLSVSQQCALAAKSPGKPHAGVPHTQHELPVRRGDGPTINRAGAGSHRVLGAVLGPTTEEEHEGPRVHPGGQQSWRQGWKACPVRSG